jgi:acetylornithine/N-succinyldiaminopimelate aminotransferase
MRSIEEGVLFLDAGRNILRMLPPLVINKEHVDQIIQVLEHVVGEEEAAKLRG